MESTRSIVLIKNSPLGSVWELLSEPTSLILTYCNGSLVDASITFPEISVVSVCVGACAEILKMSTKHKAITMGTRRIGELNGAKNRIFE